jgi:hypothetical protein
VQNKGKEGGGVPHLMSVIALLIFSASAIAMPPSGPSLLPLKLRTRK